MKASSIEIDSKSFKKIGEPVELIKSCPENHGWERTGVNNDPDCFEDEYSKAVAAFVGTKPFIEGAYMTKNNGKYYLQYSAPATERNTYADGVYVGDSPLGPFVYCKHNPFSLKPGGFITGAGHGSTFEDKYGNWWHVSTMRININNPMERRIGLFPAGFDSDGLLYCNQNYADYPFKIPNEKINPNDINPEMMLISYKKPVKASSVEDGYKASNITNENIRDIWVAKSNNEGEYVEIDLQSTARVSAIQLNFADSKIDAPSRDESVYYAKGHSKRFINLNSGCIRYRLEGSTDSESWFILKEKENIQESLQHEFLCFEKEILCRYLRITLLEQPYHQKFAMSDIRVFGKIDKSLPAKNGV